MITNNYEHQYINAMKKCLKEGYEETNTRTGKTVRRIPHVSFCIPDLEKELPFLLSKKLYSISAIDEILWIMQRQSNKRVDINSKIWDEWIGEDGTISKAYGFQIAPDIRTTVECYIAPKIVKENNNVLSTDSDCLGALPIRIYPVEECDFNSDKHMEHRIVGDTFLWDCEDAFTVLRYCGKDADTDLYDIQYLDTGYIYREVSVEGVINAYNKRSFSWNMGRRTICSVGYRGWGIANDTYDIPSELKVLLIDLWEKMINDVYTEDGSRKDPDVFVDAHWHCLENFLIDARYLPNWRLAKDNLSEYVLSKEYFVSNCYSKDTCVWLPKGEDDNYKYLDMYCEPNKDGKYLRLKLNINQMNNVILAMKNDPSSRRMLTDIWNPFELDEMNLEPCVYTANYTIIDDRLNCMLTQRSGDCCVGVPFNTFQYAVMVKLLAKSCGLKAGMLTHNIADFHIYGDQFEGAELQIERFKVLDAVSRGEVIDFDTFKEAGVLTEEMTRGYLESIVKSEPKLSLKDNGKTVDFYDWGLKKNIFIEGYVSMPPIEYIVAK